MWHWGAVVGGAGAGWGWSPGRPRLFPGPQVPSQRLDLLGLSGLWLVRHGTCIEHLLYAMHSPKGSPVTSLRLSARAVGGGLLRSFHPWISRLRWEPGWPGGTLGGGDTHGGAFGAGEGSRECGLLLPPTLARSHGDSSCVVCSWSGRQQSGLSVTPGDGKWQWVWEAEQFIRDEIRFQVLMDEAGRRLPGARQRVWTGGPAVASRWLMLARPGPRWASGPPSPREAQTYCVEWPWRLLQSLHSPTCKMGESVFCP